MKRLSSTIERFLLVGMVTLPLTVYGLDRPEPKIQARIEFYAESAWENFLRLDDFDFMDAKPGLMARIVTDSHQLERLRQQGLDITVEIDNMQEYYAARISGQNFGAYHTYSETVELLDELYAAYSSIMTEKTVIGESIEGRKIWAVKISDNPELDEDEPEVLFDAMHHAREPMSLEVLLGYMVWLCEEYGRDEIATFLVENREIWFVPVVNPDGYVYNESTYPMGGGMWRKNRRDNGDGTFGVDPNRNYPIGWGGSGSSGDTANDTYRGPEAGSEPEVQSIMNLMKAHHFISHLTMHSCVSAFIIPWSCYDRPTQDDWLIRRWAHEMAQVPGFSVYQDYERGYLVSGTTDDFAYGEQDEKNKIISCTYEVGGGDFWPPEDCISRTVDFGHWPQVYTTWVAGTFIQIERVIFTGGDNDNSLVAGEAVSLILRVDNHSLSGDVHNVEVSLYTDNPYITFQNAHVSYETIAFKDSVLNSDKPFEFTVDPALPVGTSVEMTARLQADGFSREEELTWIEGTDPRIFADDMESGTGRWNMGGSWGLTTSSSHSPTGSMTDSPSGNYENMTDSWIEIAESISLDGLKSAYLSFWHTYDTEQGYDYCSVELSDDGGGTWERLGGRFSGTGSIWLPVQLNLGAYLGNSKVMIRFRLESDAVGVGDGWYIDDVEITGTLPENEPPTVPEPSEPLPGGIVNTPYPTLVVVNASDPDSGQRIIYAFQVFADEYCGDLVSSTKGVESGIDVTEWTVDRELADGTYWWRTYADDMRDRSPLMPAASFTVEVSEEGIPRELKLVRTQPNPFSEETTLAFDIHERATVEIEILDIEGRLIRTLFNKIRGPGRYQVVWDGTDNNHRSVPNGLYVVKIQAAHARNYGKIVLLR